MSEKHHIEISVCKVEKNAVIFKMTHTPCTYCITETGTDFLASNGIVIDAGLVPFKDGVGVCIYAPEFIIGDGNGEMACSAEDFALVMQAVTEYNETDGKGYEKPWPQRNDVFYYVSATGGVVRSLYWDDDPEHLDLKKNGNFFRTSEEAEAARELVKKTLKGVDENKLLREALKEAVEMYGKPGGPWNVPGDAGGWISKARKALEVENE